MKNLKLLFLIFVSSTEVYSMPIIPDTVTFLEILSPLTWLYPAGIAFSESLLSYLKNIQHASNQLHMLLQKALVSGIKLESSNSNSLLSTKDKPNSKVKKNAQNRNETVASMTRTTATKNL